MLTGLVRCGGLKAFGSPMRWHLSVYVLFKACIINLSGRKEDQSSYLECIKPYKKPSIDGFFLLNLISSIWLQWLKHVDIRWE